MGGETYRVEEQEVELFEFEAGGEKHSLPVFSNLPFDEIAEYAHATEPGEALNFRMAEAVKAIFDRHCPGACDGMTAGQLAGLAAAYLGAKAGEPAPSSD